MAGKYVFFALSLLFILFFLLSVSFVSCTDQVTISQNEEPPTSLLNVNEIQVAASAGDTDFTRMYSTGGLFISKIIHKANIEVNEEGTEASAATAVIIVESSIQEYPVMRVDKPFVFVIHEKDSGAILFMGRINNPVM